MDQFTPAMFDCSAAGTPAPIISWFRVYDNGTTEELREGRYMLLDPEQDDGYDLEDRGIVTQVNRTLNLTTTFDDDSGTYRCVATNEAGNDTQDFELVVQGIKTLHRYNIIIVVAHEYSKFAYSSSHDSCFSYECDRH